MKHAICAAFITLSSFAIAVNESSTPLEVPFVRHENFPRVLSTRDESLTRAVLRDNIAEANYIILNEPTLLHRMTTGVPGFSGLPIDAARSVAMAQFLIDQGALDNPAETVTLLHAAMEADIPSDVLRLYLDHGITPLCLDPLHFTPLMRLAMRSYQYDQNNDSSKYDPNNNCLEKAQLLLKKLKPHEQYALFSVHDLAGGRDVFGCLKQIKKDDFVFDKKSCIELENYLIKHYETTIKHNFTIQGYGQNYSVIVKPQ